MLRDLGGPAKVSRLVKDRLGTEITPEAVSMWIKRGVPFRYRGCLVMLAQEQKVDVPPDFFGIQHTDLA